ncbi:hypothetical protein KBA27_04310 [bacterium]|nr:hypothetical protein [bacterium]
MNEKDDRVIVLTDDDVYETMDLCEYFNKILGISACSNFSDEENMTRNSVYDASESFILS